MLPLNSYQRLWIGKSFLEMSEDSIISEMELALVGTIGKKSIVKKRSFFLNNSSNPLLLPLFLFPPASLSLLLHGFMNENCIIATLLLHDFDN